MKLIALMTNLYDTKNVPAYLIKLVELTKIVLLLQFEITFVSL